MKTMAAFIVAGCLGAHDKTLRLAVALLFLASLSFASRLCGQATPPSAAAGAPAARLTILGDNTAARDGVKAVWGFAEDVARKIADSLAKEPAKLTSAGLEVVAVSQATPLFDGIAVSEPLPFGGMPTDKPGTETTHVFWEQCLTVDTPDGLVVITGCSHPGILPMLQQVKRQTGRPLYLVIGGFHLLDQPDAEVRRIATAMQAMGVAYVSATHCTGKTPIGVFRDVFGDRCVNAGVGAVINLPFVTTATGSSQQPNEPPKPGP